jgi:hypothetical protein
MKTILFLLFLPLLCLGQGSKSIKLFNGKNLMGWEVYGTEKWYVKGRILYCESGPDKGYGYLATTGKYKNFDLNLKFKPEANGNSGVFFHSEITGTRVAGWQAEVAPPGNFSGGIYESYKRGWLIKPDPNIDNVKMGKWNTMRIKVVDDVVTTWVNGVQMITLKDPAINEIGGKIALQIHDGGGIKVAWKDFVLLEL